MKKIFNILLITIMVLTLTACGNDNSNKLSSETNNSSQKENKKEEQKKNESVIIDDEIIDFDDEDNTPPGDGNVTIEKIINCDNCVFAYFSGENENAKKIGDTVTNDEYTKDINTLKTSGGKQRHNFFGLVLSGNTISRAYACILKDNKVYCMEGSVNGAYHTNNISILNQIFNKDQCKTISDGHTYTCTDGSYNGDTKTNGYTSMHYETSCTIYGSAAKTGQLICH